VVDVVECLDFLKVSGFRCQDFGELSRAVSSQPLAKITAGLIKKKKILGNLEPAMMVVGAVSNRDELGLAAS